MLILNIFIFLLGLIIGSFLNCVIYRLEKEETLKGRSYCPKCKHTLHWLDLIPVFSFLFLGRKCRYCKAKISWQYPAVEVSTGILFLLVFWSLGFGWSLGLGIWDFIKLCFMFYVSCSMIVIFVYDLKHYLIPDKILFPAIGITFVYRIFEVLNFGGWDLFGIWDLEFWISAPLINYLIASLLATAFFFSIFIVSRGQWMGFGDVKLAILLGLILGFPNILAGLFLAFFFGAIIGIGAIFLQKKGLKSEIPFGPFLITGTFIAMLWGQEIVYRYVNLIFNV